MLPKQNFSIKNLFCNVSAMTIKVKIWKYQLFCLCVKTYYETISGEIQKGESKKKEI
jgi:hypothetical protein